MFCEFTGQTDTNSESELSRQVHEVVVRTAFHFESNGYKYEDLRTSWRIREFTEEIMAIVEAWHHQQLEAKVAELRQSLVQEIAEQGPKDKSLLKLGSSNKRQEQAAVGINNCLMQYNEANAKWRELLKEPGEYK
jgi:hypothetical protein